MQTKVQGAVLLAAFLEAHGLTPTAAARALGVAHCAVLYWLSGAKRPEAQSREAITIWTRGAVLQDAWRTDEERQALDKVLPLKTGTEG